MTDATYFSSARTAQEVDDLEENLKNYESRISQMNNSHETLLQRFLQLTELRHVLNASSVFFEQAESRSNFLQQDTSDTAPLVDNAAEEGHVTDGHLGYVTGVIPTSKVVTFERVLWRILRGNLFMNFSQITEPIVDPTDSEKVVRKSVFAIFAHGQEIINKIKKISESMGGTLYSIDESADKRRDALNESNTRIQDLNNVSEFLCRSCWHSHTNTF